MLFMLPPSPWERIGCRLYKLSQPHAALKNAFYTLSYQNQKGLPYQIIQHSHESFELLFTNLPLGMGHSPLPCWRLGGAGLGFVLARIKEHQVVRATCTGQGTDLRYNRVIFRFLVGNGVKMTKKPLKTWYKPRRNLHFKTK